LVARLVRNEKVRGSNPLSSTKPAGQRPARILSSGAGSGKSAETQNFATWPTADSPLDPRVSGERWLGEQLRRYTAGMTTSLIATPDAAPEPLTEAGSLPVALTDADADRIAAAISAARTESTRRVYAYTWGQWARWCATRGLSPLPGDPAALCAYLTERAAEGIAVSSLDGACTAIRHVHRMHAATDPVASEAVRQVRLGLRRTYGTAPRRLAPHCPPLTSARSLPASIAPTRSGSATPRSSCSAIPPRCAAPSSPRSPCSTSRESPTGCWSPCAGPRPTRRDTAKPSPSPAATTATPTPSPP